MTNRTRLDRELVRRGLVPSREAANEALAAGQVLVREAPAVKPPTLVSASDPVRLLAPARPFVSRGGQKLDPALERLSVAAEDRRCLDAGASTGGFTDVLLRAGAAEVIAVDVGYGQLAEPLRADPRVRVLDRTNARHLEMAHVRAPVDLVVADLSFISLTTVLPALVRVARPDGDLLLLVKPQFEVGRGASGRGVVRDREARAAAVRQVADAAWGLGLGVAGICPSALPGPAGNAEFFLWLRAGAPALHVAELAAVVDEGSRLPGAAS